MFTLHDLTVFIAVADGGSVRQAALAMNRTQSAISQAVQRLEDAVGFHARPLGIPGKADRAR